MSLLTKKTANHLPGWNEMLFICECLNGSKALITSIYWWENLSQCFYFGCFSNFSQYVMWRSSYFLFQQLPTKLNKKYRWTEMNLLTKHVKFKSELYCCKTQTEIVDNMIKWTYLYLYGRKKKKMHSVELNSDLQKSVHLLPFWHVRVHWLSMWVR